MRITLVAVCYHTPKATARLPLRKLKLAIRYEMVLPQYSGFVLSSLRDPIS